MDAIRLYLKDIKKLPLLTAEEEIYLANKIKKGDIAYVLTGRDAGLDTGRLFYLFLKLSSPQINVLR